MEPVPQNVRLVLRAYWLIRLRWLAIAGVIATVFIAHSIAKIPLAVMQLYGIAAILGVYNIAVMLLLNHYTGQKHLKPHPAVKRIINFQMSADLFFLTLLLHFSGGIENPFVIYFVFHMILASILLSPAESYLQATLGTSLLTLMTLLEYKGFVDYYFLEGFIPADVHTEGFYLFSKVGILSSAFYLVVFMAGSIAVQLRKQEESCRLANIELKTKDRVKDEYVARVTHDIKGHLAAIQSCLDVLKMGAAGPLNKKQQDFADRGANRTKSLVGFVKSLLKLTRMRMSNQTEAEIFDLNKIIGNAVAAVEIRAQEKSIQLNTDVPENIGDMTGSMLSIEELITNMLLNAIKYTPNGGLVALKTENSGDFFKIEISDTGIGIPADEIGHVFEEFYRASNARKTEKDGTGLGLAIAKQIVQWHGGEISVTSAEGKGTAFTLKLPKKEPGSFSASFSKEGGFKS